MDYRRMQRKREIGRRKEKEHKEHKIEVEIESERERETSSLFSKYQAVIEI